MDLEHSFTVDAPVDTVWSTMMDIEGVAECFPGATVTSVEGDSFEGTCKVKLGPIALVYKGSGSFVERDDAAHRAVIDAKGKDKRGNGTAGATVTMTMATEGSGTRVQVVTDLNVTGKPAQFGRGVMQDVSDKLLGQFVDCLAGKFEAGGTPAEGGTEPPGAEASATAVSGGDGPTTAGDAPAAESSRAGSSETEASGGTGSAPAAAAMPASAVMAAGAAPGQPAAASAPAPSAGSPSSGSSSPSSGSSSGSRRATGSDDALDLGAAVLPTVLRSYAPYAVVGLVGFVLGWIKGRCGRR